MKRSLACAVASLGLLAAEPAASQDWGTTPAPLQTPQAAEVADNGFRADWVEDAAEHGINFYDCSVVTDKRRELAAEYSQMHYGMDTWKLEDPQMIVLHGTGGDWIQTMDDLVENFQADDATKSRPGLVPMGKVNTSVHFGVDQQGNVCQLLPLDMQARHAKGVNWTALGVEMISKPGWLITDVQADSTAWLLDKLTDEFESSLTHVVAHRDIWKLNDTPFVKTGVNPDYKDKSVDKTDPYGDDFNRVMQAVMDNYHDVMSRVGSFERL